VRQVEASHVWTLIQEARETLRGRIDLLEADRLLVFAQAELLGEEESGRRWLERRKVRGEPPFDKEAA